MNKIVTMMLIFLSDTASADVLFQNQTLTPGEQYLLDDKVNFREGPSLKSNRIALLPQGKKVEVGAKTGDPVTVDGVHDYFYEVTVDGTSGYLWGGFVSDQWFRSDLNADGREDVVAFKRSEIDLAQPGDRHKVAFDSYLSKLSRKDRDFLLERFQYDEQSKQYVGTESISYEDDLHIANLFSRAGFVATEKDYHSRHYDTSIAFIDSSGIVSIERMKNTGEQQLRVISSLDPKGKQNFIGLRGKLEFTLGEDDSETIYIYQGIKRKNVLELQWNHWFETYSTHVKYRFPGEEGSKSGQILYDGKASQGSSESVFSGYYIWNGAKFVQTITSKK